MSLPRASGLLVWTIILWIGLWQDLSVANVFSGLAVGVGVLLVAHESLVRARGDQHRARISWLRSIHFAGFVIYKLVEANLYLAWEIVTKENSINVGVVAVPLRTESRMAEMVVANVITLTPGTVTIESLGSPAVLYVNVMHLHDLDEVRRDLLHIEELSVRAFGSRAARRQLVGTVVSETTEVTG